MSQWVPALVRHLESLIRLNEKLLSLTESRQQAMTSREAARIEEERGNLAGAAQTWNQLAMVSQKAGKPEAAESWFRKAIEGFKAGGDKINLSKCLGNLANPRPRIGARSFQDP